MLTQELRNHYVDNDLLKDIYTFKADGYAVWDEG